MSHLLDEIRALPTDRTTLRKFGLVVGAVFLAIGLGLAWRAGFELRNVWATLASVGGVLIIGGLLAPAALRGLYRLWMGLALVLGFFMTRVLLSVVFVLVVTPIGLIMRAMGKDPMKRRADPSANTYWIRRDPADHHPDRMKRYF